MKTKLLVSVAMATLILGTAGAMAQQQEEKGGGAAGAKPAPAQHEMAPGGAMQRAPAPGAGAQLQGKPEGGASEQHSVQGGPAEERGNAPTQRGAQENQPGKAGVGAQEHAQTQSGGKPEENAQSKERNKTQENAQTQDRSKTQENAQTQEKGDRSQQNAAANKASSGKSVQLNDSQRTQIKNIVVKNTNVARVDHVDFSVNVGVAVPRSVHVEVLPADVVEIVPEYRGFDYVIVGEQLLIIDPNTMLIVDVLPV
jgi:hypothetical protein